MSDISNTYNKTFMPSVWLQFDLLTADIAACESVCALEKAGLFTKIGDLLIRGLQNIRYNFLSMFKDFTRSELLYYNQSHSGALKDLFNDRLIKLDTIKVPIPDGMQTSYGIAATMLIELYTKLDINQTLTKFDTCLHAIVANHTSNQSDTEIEQKDIKLLTEFAASTWRLTRDDLEKELRRLFRADGHNDTRPASTVIGKHVSDIEKTNTIILTFDPLYTRVKEFTDRIARIERQVTLLVDRVKDLEITSVAYVTALRDAIRVFAEHIDMYGVCLHEMQRVESNFVHSLRAILPNT